MVFVGLKLSCCTSVYQLNREDNVYKGNCNLDVRNFTSGFGKNEINDIHVGQEISHFWA